MAQGANGPVIEAPCFKKKNIPLDKTIKCKVMVEASFVIFKKRTLSIMSCFNFFCKPISIFFFNYPKKQI